MKKTPNLVLAAGRRKTAVARVYMKKGTGVITVNGREFEKYFLLPLQRDLILAPLKVCGLSELDFVINVRGGGPDGQAVAVRHGIARALVKQDEDRRSPLKEQGFLTRDSRKRERKKYGKAGARKSFQFSKR